MTLLYEISIWCGEHHSFSVSELVMHARLPLAEGLRSAIIDAVGEMNARRLGQLLLRHVNRDIAGVRIYRLGVDSDGVIWGLSRIKPASAPKLGAQSGL